MSSAISIIGMSCCYPDANSPMELWENVLAQRVAFRLIPSERLRLEDYFNADRSAPDSIYSTQAAVIKNFEFDRVKFKVAGDTFRSADTTHWLSLDTAAKAFADAGFADGKNLPKEMTGVFLGNTLTGEFTRASLMRLRYPFVRRMVESVLHEVGDAISVRNITQFFERLEKVYKEPFESIGAESLAGGLSNTIAGRICNYFDLKGGGYTIDGACSSSLLSIANACSALAAGDVDLALAGGVDLSIDPFELVGFAKTGALAAERMRVYDQASNGFFPGEGCGFVLLMREEDALKQNRKIYSTIRGWGISSDGSGGITRPDAAGQQMALQRAYLRAGFGIESVSYFEGHGTGTAVGDTTELKALSEMRRKSSTSDTKAVISSIKTLIGHTKAAAGVAGLIKATLALHNEILPPITGCETPHNELIRTDATLKTLRKAELWEDNLPLRAGVSSMGFGGINTHIVLERKREFARRKLSHKETAQISSFQDTELFLFTARSREELVQKINEINIFAPKLSVAELTDLSAQLARTLGTGAIRAAVVAASATALSKSLTLLNERLSAGETDFIDFSNNIFCGIQTEHPARIGFLFSGQGSPTNLSGGLWYRRFGSAQNIYKLAQLGNSADTTHTITAQPAIVTASLAALNILEEFDITADVGVGHSLGELTALYWAGAFDEKSLIEIAKKRGQAMTEACATEGSMLSVTASPATVEKLLNEHRNRKVCIAGFNTPSQTVVSGESGAIGQFQNELREAGIPVVKLPVSHAFHSPLVARSAEILDEHLRETDFKTIKNLVVSTVAGEKLAADEDLRKLLLRQITAPVRFQQAVENAEKTGIELWIEVGTGKILRGLVEQFSSIPVVSLEAGSESVRGLLQAIGAAFAMGKTINENALFTQRFVKPFDLNWKPGFFVNPCELAPVRLNSAESPQKIAQEEQITTSKETITANSPDENQSSVDEPGEILALTSLEIVSRLVANRLELPVSAVKSDSRMLSDLHLNSITVGQIVVAAAKSAGAPPPLSPTDFADSTVFEIAEIIEKLKTADGTSVSTEALPTGVDYWVHPFRVELTEKSFFGQPEAASDGAGEWSVFAIPEDTFGNKLRNKFNGYSGKGTIICLPPDAAENYFELLLEAAQFCIARSDEKIVFVQRGKSFAAFARTFALENPQIATFIINLPNNDDEQSVEWILQETSTTKNFVEVFYDVDGRRFENTVRPVSISKEIKDLPISSNDVLLVTGGAKGITAECVLALAKKTRTRIALIGTAQAEKDSEIAANLERFRSENLDFLYLSADVTDADAICQAVIEVEKKLGKITAILHAAARNEPSSIARLSVEKMRRTIDVKLKGAQNLIAAVPSEQLRMFVVFGSIIARTGLPGESDYGLANEWLVNFLENFAQRNPKCRCLAIEWSVWASVGMGAKIAELDILERQGIVPITVQFGVLTFLQLLAQGDLPTAVTVMSRFREVPAFPIERRELPMQRFLEHSRVYYPKVELIVDVDLSTTNDLYLDDHQVGGNRLLPAVLGLEALAQAASALLETNDRPVFENVLFSHPVVVQENSPLKIRLSALARDNKTVEVSLRSQATEFQVEHFSAVCRFDDALINSVEPDNRIRSDGYGRGKIELKPLTDLYGKILFHQGRFQRVESYKFLRSKECLAEISGDGKTAWFSRYLPKGLILGDPARRDAAIHAIQACVPHQTLLPTGVERIQLFENVRSEEPVQVYACERFQADNVFTYDLQIVNSKNRVCETWEGLRLHAVAGTGNITDLAEPLLAIYLERRINEFIGNSVISVALSHKPKLERRDQTLETFRQILESNIEIVYQANGKPETNNGKFISAAHANNLTLAVTAKHPVGCDVEIVIARDLEVWIGLIGENGVQLARAISQTTNEDFNVSATRVWTAKECLKKADPEGTANFMLSPTGKDDLVVLSVGNYHLASCLAQVRNFDGKAVFSVLTIKPDTDGLGS